MGVRVKVRGEGDSEGGGECGMRVEVRGEGGSEG